MIEITFLIVLVLISLALGQRVFRLAGIKFGLYLENFIFAFPFGLAILAYIVFFFGMMGLLYKPVIIAVIASLFVLLIKDIKGIFSILFSFIKNFKIKLTAKKYELGLNFHTIIILFISLFIILNFFISFSPPWHFDVLTYHLAVQKLYINAHGIIPLPYLFYSNIPHLADTISLVGLILNNAILSHLLAYSLGITSILAIFSFCKRFFSYKAGLLASLIFLSAPMVTEGFSIAHIDLQFALFVFLAFYGLFAYIDSNKMQWLILCSIFAGFAIATKIFGVIAAVGIFAILALHLFSRLAKKKINYKALSCSILIFSLIAFLVVLPWMFKAYLHTGNPFWPTLNEAFHGKYWDDKHTQDLAKRELVRDITIANYLRLPWDIHTQTGKERGNILEHEGAGPFFLTFLPAYFALRRKNMLINLMLILILIYISMWFFISQEFRHIIFILPLIAIISAYVAQELFKNKLISAILKTMLVFTFAFSLLVWFGGNAKEIPVALGLESVDSYYSKYPGAIYGASKFINYNLPKDSKILLFRDTRGYFLDREYVWGDPLLQVSIDYSKYSNEEDFYDDLRLLGVTHILVNNEFEYEGFIVNEYRYNERILNMMDKLLKKHAKEIYNAGGITISELRQK